MSSLVCIVIYLLCCECLGNKALWIVPMGVKALLRAIGITNVVELTWWQSHSVTSREGAVVKVTFTPTQHWTARTLFDRK